jgi:hypothetical protein
LFELLIAQFRIGAHFPLFKPRCRVSRRSMMMMMLAASVFLIVVGLNHLCGRSAVVIMICCLKDRARQRLSNKKKEGERKKELSKEGKESVYVVIPQ